MDCRKCGSKLDDGAEVCPDCGEPVASQESKIQQASTEKVNIWLCILSALIPLAGLIFYAVWKKDKPRQSKISGICALIAFIVEFIVGTIVGFYLGYLIVKGDLFPDKKNPNKPSINTPLPPDFLDPDDGNNNNSPQQPSIPDKDPAAPVYNDSADGVLKFTHFSNYFYTGYDNGTDSIIAWSGRKLSVFGRATGVERYSFQYTSIITSASAYNGTLCVGFGEDLKQLAIIDLRTGTSRTENTMIGVCEVVVTENMAVFCDNDQWCDVGVMNLADFSVRYLPMIYYQPKLAVNHEDKMLYIVETCLSSCSFVYVDLVSLDRSEKSEFGEYEYNFDGVSFDGEYVHAFGNTYDAKTGGKVAYCGHAETPNTSDYVLMKTLLRNEKYSLISEYDNRTVVYDNDANKIVYVMNLAATEIYHVGGDLYVAVCGVSGYVGLIDLSKI